MNGHKLLGIALVLILFLGLSEGKTLINVHGHWGTQDEVIGHQIDLANLEDAFNGTNVTVIDVDYSNKKLTDDSPFAYIEPIGLNISKCNDSDIVVVAQSVAPLLAVKAIAERDQSFKIAGLISLGGMWGGVPLTTYQTLDVSFGNFNTSSEFVKGTAPDSEFIRQVANISTNYPVVEIHGWVEMIFGVGGPAETSIFVPRPGSKVINITSAFHPLMYRNADVERVIVEESNILFSSHFPSARCNREFRK